jgi:hypothetical protein
MPGAAGPVTRVADGTGEASLPPDATGNLTGKTED